MRRFDLFELNSIGDSVQIVLVCFAGKAVEHLIVQHNGPAVAHGLLYQSAAKAGIGGTPSELGMIRFESNVVKEGQTTPIRRL